MSARAGSTSSGHGIDLAQAQALWLDEELDEFRVERAGEPRFTIVGRIGVNYWTAAVTYRGGSVRLSSVRRSRAKEVEEHER
jgi:uncharacterized DUF497 family protein